MKKYDQGFTLIELLVTVAIIGILAAIAIPSYGSYVTNSKRKQAEAVMLNISQMEERYYTNNYTYYAISTAPPTPEPQGWPNYAGNNIGSRIYNISVTISPATSATSYKIQADPYGFPDSQCGSLTLDSTGLKGNTKGTSGASPCW